MDAAGTKASIVSTVTPVDADGVAAEWVIRPTSCRGGGLAPVVRSPKPMALWMSFLMHGVNPREALISPLFGDLSGLPPTLIQASLSEMFLDDAVRYANKANAQGSRVVLQTWPHTMHGWHAMDVSEAAIAFDRIRAFLN